MEESGGVLKKSVVNATQTTTRGGVGDVAGRDSLNGQTLLEGHHQKGNTSIGGDNVTRMNDLQQRNEELELDKRNANFRADLLSENLEKVKAELALKTKELETLMAVIEKESTHEKTSRRLSNKVEVNLKKTQRIDTLRKQMRDIGGVHYEVYETIEQNASAIGKSVAKSLDALLVSSNKYFWWPPPRKVGPGNGVGTMQAGCRVPEPPMMGALRSPSGGGLFALQWVSAEEEAEDVNLELRFWAKACVEHAREQGTLCEELRTASEDVLEASLDLGETVAAVDAMRAVKSGKSNGCSVWKARSFEEYMDAIGVKSIPKKNVVEAEVRRGCGEGAMGSLDVFRNFLAAGSRILGVDVKGLLSNSNDGLTGDGDAIEIAGKFTTEMMARWRTCLHEEIRSTDAFREVRSPVRANGGVDKLFSNTAARVAYISWSGRRKTTSEGLDGDFSVLSLARLDAWIATKLIAGARVATMALGEVDSGASVANDAVVRCLGRGGGRSLWHNVLFEKLLPVAVEGILNVARGVVEEKYPRELRKPFSWNKAKDIPEDDAEAFDKLVPVHAESYYAEHKGDIHNNNGGRVLTVGVIPPQDAAADYVYMLPEAFRSEVCWWVGSALDVSVGRSDLCSSSYARILSGSFVGPTCDESEDGQEEVDQDVMQANSSESEGDSRTGSRPKRGCTESGPSAKRKRLVAPAEDEILPAPKSAPTSSAVVSPASGTREIRKSEVLTSLDDARGDSDENAEVRHSDAAKQESVNGSESPKMLPSTILPSDSIPEKDCVSSDRQKSCSPSPTRRSRRGVAKGYRTSPRISPQKHATSARRDSFLWDRSSEVALCLPLGRKPRRREVVAHGTLLSEELPNPSRQVKFHGRLIRKGVRRVLVRHIFRDNAPTPCLDQYPDPDDTDVVGKTLASFPGSSKLMLWPCDDMFAR